MDHPGSLEENYPYYFSDDDAANADKLEEILISLLNFPGRQPGKSGRKWDPYYFSDDDAPNADKLEEILISLLNFPG